MGVSAPVSAGNTQSPFAVGAAWGLYTDLPAPVGALAYEAFSWAAAGHGQ